MGLEFMKWFTETVILNNARVSGEFNDLPIDNKRSQCYLRIRIRICLLLEIVCISFNVI